MPFRLPDALAHPQPRARDENRQRLGGSLLVQADAVEQIQVGTVTIAVTATTPKSTGHGFRFVSDPATTTVSYAQIGRERDGVFFS